MSFYPGDGDDDSSSGWSKAPKSPRYSPVNKLDPEFMMEQEQSFVVDGGCRWMDNPPEPYLIEKAKRENRRVTLNVGGERHETLWKTLEHIPHSRLGKLRKCNSHSELLDLCDDYSLLENEFYFERQPACFSVIINFYRTGKLHLVEDVCVLDFADELDYWGIDSIFLEDCCQQKFNARQEYVFDEMKKMEAHQLEVEDFGDGPFSKFQKTGWDTMEKPETSLVARIIASVSIFFLVISTVSLCVNTFPTMQMWECINETDTKCIANLDENPPRPGESPPDDIQQIENIYLAQIEFICIVWFTLEYLFRFLFCPSKKAFLKGPLNFIDVLAIMPFYLTHFLMDAKQPAGEDDAFRKVFRKFVQVFRLMRVLRIFKLGRHSRGLQALGYTVTNSYKELGHLIMFLSICVLIFSAAEFNFEGEENSEQFTSIPHTFWWAIITMTTVGYGDISPITGIGQLIGSMCAVTGVLVIALPIPIIGNNFAKYYQNSVKREELIKRKEELERAKREKSIFRSNIFLNVSSSETLPSTDSKTKAKAIIRANSVDHAPRSHN